MGPRPVQVYATTEAPIVAAGGLEHRELRIFEDLVWIEVVDEQNRPVPAGTPGYKVLLTNLVNYAQPLIRYELTDAITLAPNGDIASIDGRSDDTLLLPGENGKPVTVPPFRLRAPFTPLKDVRTYQLVHDGDSIDARVVLQPNSPHSTLARVRQHFSRRSLRPELQSPCG